MLGRLPKTLNIGGEERAIRSDYRVALLIFQAFNDSELNENEKTYIMLDCLYEHFESINEEFHQEAMEKAVWFLDGGSMMAEKQLQPKKVMDWEQDEQMIFSSINKVAKHEVRSVDYMHLWTFLGFFSEIEEGLFTNVISIRNKKNKGKKLEKYEQEFYKENKHLIDLKTRYSAKEQAEIDELNRILG